MLVHSTPVHCFVCDPLWQCIKYPKLSSSKTHISDILKCIVFHRHGDTLSWRIWHFVSVLQVPSLCSPCRNQSRQNAFCIWYHTKSSSYCTAVLSKMGDSYLWHVCKMKWDILAAHFVVNFCFPLHFGSMFYVDTPTQNWCKTCLDIHWFGVQDFYLARILSVFFLLTM